MLLTDTTLLLIMIAGLLRLHRRSNGSYQLLRLLWKQVGHLQFSLAVILPTDVLDILEGVMWFVIATVAEVPPAVSLRSIFVPEYMRLLLISVLYCRCS